jgi:hypothetical protein
MNGSQGEIAHIDLTNGSEIIRVLLERGLAGATSSTASTATWSPLTVGGGGRTLVSATAGTAPSGTAD